MTSSIFPEVETSHGRLRGLQLDGVHIFKGIPYGDNTAGKNRFLPPQPAKPWTGTRDSTAYGNYAPQLPISRMPLYMDLILYDVQPGGMGEDCLVLNVWTTSLSPQARRPVMVHLHGGGWYGGSGNSPQFDGTKIAGHADVVFVTVNHRLGAFGFLDLSEAGEARFEHSAANGMLDIIAALEWVRQNISAFGGDPDRVLVFGQSGGGAKTSVLSAMPGAEGLFHRAGIMSGSATRIGAREETAKTTWSYLRLLGLTHKSLDRLASLPMGDLLAAQVQLENVDRDRGEAPRTFLPVASPESPIPRHPFEDGAPSCSMEVPFVIGTTLEERTYRLSNFDLTYEQLSTRLEESARSDIDRLLDRYREASPGASAYLLNAQMDTDATFGRNALKMSLEKSAQAAAPCWTYLWASPSSAYGGRFGAVHGVDLGPSLFDVRLPLNGPSAANTLLAQRMSAMWTSFAATGVPSVGGLGEWQAFDKQDRHTLVVHPDGEFRQSRDPRAELRDYWLHKV